VAELARRAVPVAVAATVLAVVALATTSVLHWNGATDVHARVNAFWALSWAGLPVVGAVVVVKRPENVLGWLLVAVGICFGTGLSALAYAELVLKHGHALPGHLIALAVSRGTVLLGLATVFFLLLLFPGGRLPGDRWRHLARAAAVVFGVLVVAHTLRGTLEYSFDGRVVTRLDNPLALTPLAGAIERIIPVVGVVAVLLALVAIGRIVVRFRGATGVERAQLKWFAAATAAFPVLFVAAVQLDAVGDRDVAEAAVVAVWVLGINAIAAAIGVAVLRYRLFEIDRLVRRTVAYTGISAVLIGVYGVVVLGFGSLSRTVAGGSDDLAVAASTLAVAAAFGPVRRRVHSAVDRRFDRVGYDAQRTIATFGRRLRDDIDLERAVEELRVTAFSAVRPRTVRVWLAADRGATR
jgi:hypothetical protein